MKIALFHNLPSGGAKRHTYEQLKELAKRGYGITEYAPACADFQDCSFAPFVKEQRIYEAPELKLRQKRIPLVTPYLHAWQIVAHLRHTEHVNRMIARDIDADGYDLMLAKDCHIISSPYVLRFLATKSLFQCHHVQRPSMDPTLKQDTNARSIGMHLKQMYYHPVYASLARYFRRHETLNIRSATRVLTNSGYSERVLSNLFGIQAHAIYPGIDTQMFAPQNLPEAEYVLSVGALTYSKGHRFVVSALALIDPARRPPLFIAANSRNQNEERRIKLMAAETGVDIHIETITDSEHLVRVYSQARVFVYAPLQEALGMAPLEAMACGTPVVAVGEGGVLETVRDEVTGYLVPRDAKLFAERLQFLLGNDALRRRMSEASTAYVQKEWTWAQAVDELEKQIHQVIEK